MGPSSPVPASPASAAMPVKPCDGPENLQTRAGFCSAARDQCEAGRPRGERTRPLSTRGLAGARAALSTPRVPLVEQKEMVRVVFPQATRAGIAPASWAPMGHVPSDEDKPLGSGILPALHLTALLLAAVGFGNPPAAQHPPPPVAVVPEGPPHIEVSPSPAVSREAVVCGVGVENRLSGFADFVNRRK